MGNNESKSKKASSRALDKMCTIHNKEAKKKKTNYLEMLPPVNTGKIITYAQVNQDLIFLEAA